jgi:hypothetical protein
MTKNSLGEAMTALSAMWGATTSELVEASRLHIETLAKAAPDEDWLAALRRDQPASRELYRDPRHGFVLLAHFEKAGLYRPPHDHGRSWVIYAVQQGESEMGTYGRVEQPDGRVRLVKRDTTLVQAGQSQVYLPGDIHDTLCLAGPALLFRFTERDLKNEDQVERRVNRFVQQDGLWTRARSAS